MFPHPRIAKSDNSVPVKLLRLNVKRFPLYVLVW